MDEEEDGEKRPSALIFLTARKHLVARYLTMIPVQVLWDKQFDKHFVLALFLLIFFFCFYF